MNHHTDPPGVRRAKPSRFRPRFHWELLSCGVTGHLLVGRDAREFRPEDRLVARVIDGARFHRCLRCDSWLPVAPIEPQTRDFPPSRDEIELPLRGRPLRDKIVLRLIAINRAFHFLALGLIAVVILVFSANRGSLHATVYKVLADVQGATVANGSAKHGLVHDVDRLFSLQSGRLHLFAAVAAIYALVEGIEAVGLWYQKRWAEYLTFLVTASLLPVEVYELTSHTTPFKILAFLINVAVVVYLLWAKRLFGLNGGAAAEHALREADMGWPAVEAATPGGGAGAGAGAGSG